jgi:hypothetical protein
VGVLRNPGPNRNRSEVRPRQGRGILFIFLKIHISFYVRFVILVVVALLHQGNAQAMEGRVFQVLKRSALDRGSSLEDMR